MNLLLSENLKRLRKEKGNTQEDLAVHLGITVQAVSKWERNEGYPDITILPTIASYYNVTVDDLLGVGSREIEKKVRVYQEEYAALFRAGKNAERVALMRKAQQEFPNNLDILIDLMYALQAEDRVKYADEIIEYGQRILKEAKESSARDCAIQSLCFTYYYAKGDAETAQKYAQMAGSYAVTREELMPRFLEGDDAVRYCQMNLQRLIEMIGVNTNIMIRKGQYTPEMQISAYRFVIDCYERLYADGRCGFYHVRLSEFYERMAGAYFALNQIPETLDCLDKAVDHAIRFDRREDGRYTAFMVNKVNAWVSDAVKDHQETRSEQVLNSLKGIFAALEKEPHVVRMKTALQG